MNSTLLTILELAETERLPARWLKNEAIAGRIPSLRVGRRFYFNGDAVRRALAERAATFMGDYIENEHPETPEPANT